MASRDWTPGLPIRIGSGPAAAFALRATAPKEAGHYVWLVGNDRPYIASSKRRAIASAFASRGDKFVRRSCASVPSTSVGMSDDV